MIPPQSWLDQCRNEVTRIAVRRGITRLQLEYSDRLASAAMRLVEDAR